MKVVFFSGLLHQQNIGCKADGDPCGGSLMLAIPIRQYRKHTGLDLTAEVYGNGSPLMGQKWIFETVNDGMGKLVSFCS
ncbi:hypothetical protein D3C77_767760 [compost metagenome]